MKQIVVFVALVSVLAIFLMNMEQKESVYIPNPVSTEERINEILNSQTPEFALQQQIAKSQKEKMVSSNKQKAPEDSRGEITPVTSPVTEPQIGDVERETRASQPEYFNDPYVHTYQSFYETGEVLSETPRLDGENHGIVKDFYKSGRLKSEKLFEKGRIVKRKDYYESGQVRQEHIYNDEAIRKQIIDYNEYGDLVSIRDWIAGKWVYRKDVQNVVSSQN